MGKIIVVGLGPGSLGLITLETWDKLQQAPQLLLKTAKHPMAAELTKRKIVFTAYDELLANKASAAADCQIAAAVIAAAQQFDSVVYAVPGNPLATEGSVALVREKADSLQLPVQVLAGVSVTINPLIDIMARLRSPGGCIWDIEQTHASLRRNLIEEVYEVIEAIDLKQPKLLCEELGDLLLQIVFHARLAEESGLFAMQAVVDGITEKLIRRHPHVFADTTVSDSSEVILNWEAIKQQEKRQERRSVLDGVPKDLPALMRADKLQRKAAKIGFDWDNISFVWDKIREEIAELKEAIESGDKTNIEAEFGDCLFSLVNLSRFLNVDAEVALNQTNRKFKRRFSYIEERLKEQQRKMENVPLSELDLLWNEAKVLNL